MSNYIRPCMAAVLVEVLLLTNIPTPCCTQGGTSGYLEGLAVIDNAGRPNGRQIVIIT
jgi:hypothetical protein